MTEIFSILSSDRIDFPVIAKEYSLTDKTIVPLIEAKKGQSVRIHALPHGKLRAYFIRLGISEGDSVVCHERLPGGTVVLRKNRQEVAIGHKLAGEILVVILQKERA